MKQEGRFDRTHSMKRTFVSISSLRLVGVASFCLIFSCAQAMEYETLRLRFPDLGQELTDVLGDPHWVLSIRESDGLAGPGFDADSSFALFHPGQTASVLAYPTWPEHAIREGIFRPAGAVYPFGVRSGELALNWKGGVAAYFHGELARIDGPSSRSPDFFDWPGFLDLLESAPVDEAFRGDPWLVDWTDVAHKTRLSGFDRRRLVPRPASLQHFILPFDGPWFPSSPFGALIRGGTGSGTELSSTDEVDSLVSLQGIFRYRNGIGGWFLSPSCVVPRLQL